MSTQESGTVTDPNELGFGEEDDETTTTTTTQDDEHDEDDETTQPSAMEKAVAELAASNKAILETVRKPKEEAPVKMSPEQEAEFWGIYDPEKTDKDFFRKWFRLNPEATTEEIQSVKELFAAVQKGIVGQGIKGAKNYVDFMMKKLQDEYAPLKEFVETAKQEKTRSRFFDKYPTLKDKKYEKILTAAATGLSNKEFNDEDHYFKELAESSAEAIKGLIPDFDLGKTTTTTTRQAPRLPRTRVGGGGGAGKGQNYEPTHVEDKSSEVWEE